MRRHGISVSGSVPEVLDSGVPITAGRDARRMSELLATLEHEHGESEIVLSSITAIELEHGMHRAHTVCERL